MCVYVCVCECFFMCVCVFKRDSETECACACACGCVRVCERVCTWEQEKERGCVFVYMHYLYVREGGAWEGGGYMRECLPHFA